MIVSINDSLSQELLLHMHYCHHLDEPNSLLRGAPERVLLQLQVMENNRAREIHPLPGCVHISPVLQELLGTHQALGTNWCTLDIQGFELC